MAATCLVMLACGDSNPMPVQAPPSMQASNDALLDNQGRAADLSVGTTVAATAPAQAPACGDIFLLLPWSSSNAPLALWSAPARNQGRLVLPSGDNEWYEAEVLALSNDKAFLYVSVQGNADHTATTGWLPATAVPVKGSLKVDDGALRGRVSVSRSPSDAAAIAKVARSQLAHARITDCKPGWLEVAYGKQRGWLSRGSLCASGATECP